MAKMFYTLEEAAQRLGKSAEEVREMAANGRVQEFRDRDRLMFKVDQIDLLTHEGGGDAGDLSSVIPLADSVTGDLKLADSMGGKTGVGSSSPATPAASDVFDLAGGSAFGVGLSGDSGPGASGSGGMSGSGSGRKENAKQKTGVSIFDAEDLEKTDPSAVTQVTSGGLDDLSLEPVGSGSGLLDLTRESDDTSLGAVDFLEEMGGREASAPAAPEPVVSGTGLFEGTSEEVGAGAGMGGLAPAGMAMIAAEPYDGPGSGLVGGLSFGAVAALAVGVVVVITGILSGGAGGVATMIADNMMIVVGALAGVTLIGAGLGFMLGKKA